MEIGKKPIITSSSPPSSPSSSSSSSMTIILLVMFLFTTRTIFAAPRGPFTPTDSILIDCGTNTAPKMSDGKSFKSDQDASKFLETKDDAQVSVSKNDLPSPVYLNAKVFPNEATYTFELKRPGYHWLRLYFYAFKDSKFDLQQSTSSVSANHYALLHNFKASGSEPILKEYLLNMTEPNLKLKFTPMKNSFAFVNAIEVVSAPDSLIADSGTLLFPVNKFQGLTTLGYQVVYRLNMGGPLIMPTNDTLGRTWKPDNDYLKEKNFAKQFSGSTTAVRYNNIITPLIAPAPVYATLVEMATDESNTVKPNFNVTWQMDVDTAFDYLLRFHFCDIVSKALNDLYFNVYINGKMAMSGLDLSSLTGALGIPFFKDMVVNASTFSSGKLMVQIGPLNQDTGTTNAILNGLEVLKISNSVDSLDGEFGVDGRKASSNKGTVAVVGFAMMFGAFVGLGAMLIRWKRRPQDWQKRNSFSSWLLPLHAGDSSFLSKSNGSQKSTTSGLCLGRSFSLAELQEATNNFDSSAIIGVGGFGNVYLGTIDEGTEVAVKRGNPQSEQGITEFHTEIQMLSKLRHRHLVSLIGYCDENDEMILVYEYMSNGPFRDHLYGKELPSLSWKQRLEICIGSARGLHYLHTGTAQGIIHRDVKTTNILLDDAFVAKVADFGLSKDTPMGQNHVSTAVKGSFGYLDPEYFRRQQLTEKSDVYSFGVVLLESLCARPAINPQLPREQVNLAEWAMQWKRKGLLEKIIDPSLVGNINAESMNKFAEAAEKCLAEYGTDRPSMGDVLWNLEHALQLQEQSLEGKTEEQTPPPSNAAAATAVAPVSPPITPSSDTNPPVPQPETTGMGQPTGEQSTEHSGSAMFAQFQGLDGR